MKIPLGFVTACVLGLSILTSVGCTNTAEKGTQSALTGYPAPVNNQSQQQELPNYSPPIQTPPLVAPSLADIPIPENGLSSVGCIPVYADVNKTLAASIKAYLTPAVGDKKDLLYPVISGPTANDFVTFTNEKGWLLFNDVPPGNYFLIVIRVPGWSVVSESQNNLSKPMLIKLDPNGRLNLGIVYLP